VGTGLLDSDDVLLWNSQLYARRALLVQWGGTYSMGMVPKMLLDRCRPHPSNVDIPTVYKVSARCVQLQTILIRAPVDDFHFREAYSFLVARCGGYAGDHHKLHQLLCLQSELPTLCFLQPVFGRGDVLVCKRF
jgi:hypothetical protein